MSLTKEDVKRIQDSVKKQPPEPLTEMPKGCTCVPFADPMIGVEKVMIRTNPSCIHHGWLPVEEDG